MIEINKTGIWEYDQFPYALAAKVERETLNYIYVEGYTGFAFDKDRIKLMLTNATLKHRIDSVTRRYREARERLLNDWEHIALLEIPELAKLNIWKKWKEENV